MPSSITVTFNSIPTPGDNIFYAVNPRGGFIQSLFATQRIQAQQVQISTTTIGFQTVLLQNAFNADFNSFSEYTFEFPTSQSIRIIKKVGQNFFDGAAVQGPTAFATIVTTSTPDPVAPELQSVNYAGGCLDLQASLVFNQTLTTLNINNRIITVPIVSPYIIVLPRGRVFPYTASVSGEISTGSIETPALWILTEIRQTVTNNGVVVDIVVVETGNNRNTLEYSLDGVNYVSSNIFPSLLAGSFTAYVRDSYGCNQQANFTISEDPFTQSLELYSDFPLLNSFHFIKSEEVNGCDTYQTELNTASFLQDGYNGKRFYHLVQKCDCIRIQFHSNYDNHSVKIYNCDGIEIDLNLEQKTNNVNQYDVRDNVVSSVDDKLVFYINGGNIYDPETDAVISPNTIVNDLFTYNRIDSIVEIEDFGFVKIKDINYIESLDAWVAITDVSYSGVTELKKVTSNYNIEEYEVYEFEYDFQNLEGIYFIGVTGEKGTNTFEYVSEFINVQEKHENTDEIIHRHTTNKEIDYRTGIIHYMRIPRIIRDLYASRDENEIYTKDTDVVSIDSELFRSKTFNWGMVPTAIIRKIDEALSNDTLYINRQQYIKEETPEITPLGQGSNLYSVRPTLRIAKGNMSGFSKTEVQIEVYKFSNALDIFSGEVNSNGFIALGDGGLLKSGVGNINI